MTEPFRWSALMKKAEGAEESAADEAKEIARALTAHSIVMDREAVVEEWDDRYASIAAIVWGDAPTDGYGLHASLGAYLVAKVAVGMVPAGHTGLRHEPLRRAGIHNVLRDHGLDAATADSILGDFEAVSPGFEAHRDGIGPSLLAGLAERTLGGGERIHALSEVAYSPRSLQRLAATASLLAAIRAILPVLPPASLGADVATAVVAIALGRPDRAIELFGQRADRLALKTFVEIAAAMDTLGRGEALVLDDDSMMLVPPAEAAAVDDGTDDIEADAFDTSGEDEDDDDVLEIVEERVDPEEGTLAEATPRGAPNPARFVDVEPLDEAALLDWQKRLHAGATIAAQRAALLGLNPSPVPPTVTDVPIPPDERILRREMMEADDEGGEKTERIDLGALMADARVQLDGTAYDALFPAPRGLLRTIAAAADGQTPSADAVTKAGDLETFVSRARALGFVVRGSLDDAKKAVSRHGDDVAPEGRWATDRQMRYADEPPPRVGPQEARPAAAALIEDLAHQLARTIAATVPNTTLVRDGADG